MKDGIVEVGLEDMSQIELFLKNAGNSLVSFRYFETRPLNIIVNHLVTILYFIDNQPVGYGHLDQANDHVWLGVAVHAKKRGIGTCLVSYLIKKGYELSVDKIHLSVDKNNEPAIQLYNKMDFKRVNENNTVLFYELTL